MAFGPSQMRTLHLIGPDGTYTNLAFLLSDQCNHTVKLAVFEGSKKSVFKDRQELTGSLLQQLEDAYGYIDRFNRTRASSPAWTGWISGTTRPRPCGRRCSTPWSTGTTPSAALPLLVSLRIGSSSSPSAAWPGASGWRTSAWAYQCCGNPDLANFFYRLRLIEAYGTGILRIHECYAGAAVQPAIEATDHAFKITLPNLNFSREAENTPPARPATSLGKREAGCRRSSGCAERTAGSSGRTWQAALGVSQATAILLLREMTRDGLLEKQGTAKNLRYYLAET